MLPFRSSLSHVLSTFGAMPSRGLYVAGASVLLLGLCAGCLREKREFHVDAPLAARGAGARFSALQPGPRSPGSTAAATATAKPPYRKNAYAMAEGQRLYTSFNCNGCHGMGGGGMGPPLLDGAWRYGSSLEHIYASILEGRPNGMPSFRGKLPQHQAWQIAAYVQSLSGRLPQDAAPSRADDMKSSPPPNSVDPVRQLTREPPPTRK